LGEIGIGDLALHAVPQNGRRTCPGLGLADPGRLRRKDAVRAPHLGGLTVLRCHQRLYWPWVQWGINSTMA